MYTYSFEKLEVWVEAKNLVLEIYALTKKFPDDEKFGLSSQLRRAAISVCSNLAEGSGRKSNIDKAHFYILAFSSAVEVLNQIIIAKDLKFIDENKYLFVRSKIESITNKINALRGYQINK